MGALVCDYIAPALALALKYPVSDPNVEFIPSLLSLVSFSCMHIINELLEQFCVENGVLRGPC